MLQLEKLYQTYLSKQQSLKSDGQSTQNQPLKITESDKEELISTLSSESFTSHLAKSEIKIVSNKTIPPASKIQDYLVIGIDGSQIYPSRHEATSNVGMIKTAATIFDYSTNPSSFQTQINYEFLFADAVEKQFPQAPEIFFSPSLLDCFRQLEELGLALEMAKTFPSRKALIMLDATLNFNFLKNINPAISSFFLNQAEQILRKIQKAGTTVISYTSWPKSNGVAKGLKTFFCTQSYFERAKCYGNCNSNLCSFLTNKNDADILSQLPQSQPVFQYSGNKIGEMINYFYLSSESETARIDQIHQNKPENMSTNIILDQLEKGRGYPLALSEAHVSSEITTAENVLFDNLTSDPGPNPEPSPKQKSKQLVFG